MISKRKTTWQQKAALKALDAAEYVAKRTPLIICSGVTLLCIVGLQKIINQQTIYNCSLKLNVLRTYPTAIGDAYFCVSRLQVYGPPVPLKD